MSYAEFTIDDVTCRLILELHRTKRNEPLEDLDALVIETAVLDPANVASVLTKNSSILTSLPHIQEEKIPIYSVDISLKNGLFERYLPFIFIYSNIIHSYILPFFLISIAASFCGAENKTALSIMAGMAAVDKFISLFLGYSKDKDNNNLITVVRPMISYLSFLYQSPVVELRNAIAAKKIKEGVIPRLKELYKDKYKKGVLKIGIIYGAGHAGIKECLESESRTNVSLWLHRYYSIPFLDRETLNNFWEYRINAEGNVTGQKYECKII